LSPAGALALKLVVTPVLIGAASLAGRRWGSALSGWLIGIPFTSAPIAFFLALDPGPAFAARAAAAIMAGAISQAVFCLVFAWTARRARWASSLVAGTIGFSVATVVLTFVLLPVAGAFVIVIIVLVVALFLMPAAPARPGRRVTFPRWDLPARMLVATAFVVVLTSAAPLLGPRVAGLLAPYPLYGGVLAVFAYRLEGADAAVAVLRGLLLGLFAFGCFFAVLATLLEAELWLAFAAAILVAAVIQGTALVVGRRLGLA
jgi:phage shock protein PspC (stress-responsive transcriptional regulator)